MEYKRKSKKNKVLDSKILEKSCFWINSNEILNS